MAVVFRMRETGRCAALLIATAAFLHGSGVVFALNPDYHTLYTFCAQPSCHDGAIPVSPLLLDQSGDVIGMTVNGGTHGGGEVFELTP